MRGSRSLFRIGGWGFPAGSAGSTPEGRLVYADQALAAPGPSLWWCGRRGWRSVVVGARVVVSLLSMVVLVISGYGWTQLRHIEGGLTRADVITAAPVVAGKRRTPDRGPAAGTSTKPDATSEVSSPEQNILLVGLDSRTDAEGNPLPPALLAQLHAGGSGDGGDSTDTMIVLHIPADGRRATAISIPRDSYVQIADGFGQHKINSAYTYGKNAAAARGREQELRGGDLERVSAQAGARTAIGTVQQLTGLTITHYAAVNLVGFDRISAAVGGVWVCLNAPAHDDYSGADLPSGWQSLQGPQALAFVRQRHGLPAGDFDRVRRQQVFLAALAHQVLAAGTLADPTALNHLVSAVRSSVTVDEGFDMLAMAAQLRHLSTGDLTFATIPTGTPALPTPGDGQAVEVNPDQVHTFIHTLTATPPPAPAAGPTLQPVARPSPGGSPSPDHSASPAVPITAGDPTCTN